MAKRDSGVFRDSVTNEVVLAVIRGFVGDKRLLIRWTVSRLRETKSRKSTLVLRRLPRFAQGEILQIGDPSGYATIGYTTGVRGDPAFALSTVIHEPKNLVERLCACAEMFEIAAHLWNMVTNRCPDGVVKSVIDFMADKEIPGLDRNLDGPSIAVRDRVRLGDTLHEITTFDKPTQAALALHSTTQGRCWRPKKACSY